MTKLADLHIHTHFSDSTSSPEEVIEHAQKASLSCIAITDHDTTAGVGPTIEVAKEFGIEVIPGIEMSSEIDGKDVHVLGYFIDYSNQELLDELSIMQNSRVERMKQMIAKLADLGIDGIELDEVCSLAKSKAVGRPHLATVLVEKGKVSDMRAAFDKYLADDAPAFVPKLKKTTYEVIKLINTFGGVAVLAHPMITRVDERIPSFVEAGMQGIEVHYPNNTDNVTNFYTKIAQKHNLVITGGSDAHGDAKKHTYVGKVKVSYEVVEKLKEVLDRSKT